MKDMFWGCIAGLTALCAWALMVFAVALFVCLMIESCVSVI